MSLRQPNVDAEYTKAFQSPQLDNSEFIMLLIGYLQDKNTGKPNPKLNEALSQVRQLYTDSRYSEAIQVLFNTCNQNPELVSKSVFDLIQAQLSRVKDDPDQNHNRRFFETRLSLENDKIMEQTIDFGAIEQLVRVMKDLASRERLINASYNQRIANLPNEVRTKADALKVLSSIWMFNDKIELNLKSVVDDYRNKDRNEKPSSNKLRKVVGGKIVETDIIASPESRTMGIMKSFTPNFYDFMTTANLSNRVVDRYSVDKTKNEGFSGTHQNIPFVNSISGTSFSLAVLLSEYLEKTKNDPNLQARVNNIVKTFINLYIKEGFHSLDEMKIVLNHPNVQKIFNQYQVKLDLGFPEQVVNQSFEDTLQYTKVTALKKKLLSELPSITQLGLDKGRVVTFTSEGQRGRLYMEFESDKDKVRAYQALVAKFGPEAVRDVTARANTIEFLTIPIKKYIASVSMLPSHAEINTNTVRPPLSTQQPRPAHITPMFQETVSQDITEKSLSSALEKGLKEGELYQFQDKPGKYLIFKNKDEFDAAVALIESKYGVKLNTEADRAKNLGLCRLARIPNSMEIYDNLQKLLIPALKTSEASEPPRGPRRG